ncbi:hypothetical protein BG005_005399 [Podila minutissima]|nr:hypothetical protein BG005_005399 [Podila minutissima]
MEIMSQGPDANRRKSRLATSLFKRSFGAGGLLARSTLGSSTLTSTTTTAAGTENILFGSIRNQASSSSDQNPFRRSMRANSSDMSQSQQHHQQLNQQHVSLPLTEVRPISKELEDPIATLCVAVDQLVEKMTVVADIHKGLASFNESFGSFLYGLQMNASTVEWSEAPLKDHFERQQQREAEAELLRKQQEELEQIRQRQLVLEQEQELERQRLEEGRQEAERAHAAEAAATAASSKLQKPRVVARAPGGSGGPGGSGSSAGGGGAGRGRIPRPVVSTSSSSAAPSRVGPGGQVRKLVGKLVMKKMADRLPLKYRDEPHRGALEAIMRSLGEHIEGQYLPELVAVAGVARHRCNEYLGVLVHAKEVIKTSHKGVLFQLNPDRYPSR